MEMREREREWDVPAYLNRRLLFMFFVQYLSFNKSKRKGREKWGGEGGGDLAYLYRSPLFIFLYFSFLYRYRRSAWVPTSTMGVAGQRLLISGIQNLSTFFRELGFTTLKQSKITSDLQPKKKNYCIYHISRNFG